MNLTSFEDVIDFAIKREKEAVKFYVDLQKISRFSAQKSLLKEFELMEHGHVNLLNSVKKRNSAEKLKVDIPADIKLNEYLVESLPVPEMSYQDILIIAIKREEKSAKLYSGLLAGTSDSSLRNIFEKLVSEEKKHKHHFEVIYEKDIQADN